jgi:WD40 repeat protein
MSVRKISGRDPDYQFIKVIGKGGFGTVTLVKRLSDSKIMACKAIDCSLHPALEALASRELATWTALGKEKYIAVFSNDAAFNSETKTIRLYMDYYKGGDLQGVMDICENEDANIHPIMVMHWAVEIARAVKACHDNGIIHRDIKPQNILMAFPYKYNNLLWSANNDKSVKPDEQLAAEFLDWLDKRAPWCHLTDFGLGKFSTGAFMSRNTSASLGVLGTQGFMAPESLGDSPVFSSKSDVYSLGCLLYTLCQLRPLSMISGVPVSKIPDCYPKRIQDIINQCLQSDPSARPSSRELLNELHDAYIDLITSSTWIETTAILKQDRNQPSEGFVTPRSIPIRQDWEPTLLKADSPAPGSVVSKRQLPQTLKGHPGKIIQVAFSVDGKLLASMSDDYRDDIRIWDVSTGVTTMALKGAFGSRAIAFSPNGKLIAVAMSDKIQFWHVDKGEKCKFLHYSDSDHFQSIAFSPDSTLLASFSTYYSGDIKLWNVAEGARSDHLSTSNGTSVDKNCSNISFSPDGRFILSVSRNVVKLMSVSGKGLLIELDAHSDNVKDAAFSPFGKILAWTVGNNIKLWDMETMESLEDLTGHQDEVLSIAFSPDGKLFASGSKDKTVKLWDMGLRKLIRTIEGHSEKVNSVAFSPSGKLLATGSDDKTVMLWDAYQVWFTALKEI